MDLLLCIVEANAAAKALASVASHSLHAVEDCGCIVECCTKVLPAALSALEGVASTDENSVGQAIECVQGCILSMLQLQSALESLNGHDSEGVLGILLEHTGTWLHTYRAFRGLTGQLVAISCFVRAAAQCGRADDSEEALQGSIKVLMATCARAREAANLLGSDLPELARAAAAAGWSSERVRLAVTGSGATSPCRRCGSFEQGACSCSSGGGASALTQAAAVLAAASAALQKQEQTACNPHQRMSFLRRISTAAVCNSPMVRHGRGGSSPPDQLYASCPESGGAGLEGAVCALVARIQDAILYDSEVDQLEQDRAYLQERVSRLHEACGGSDAVVAASSAALESIIQSEVLLAAVNSRLRFLGEQGNISASVMCVEEGGVMAHSRARSAAAAQLLVSDQLYDDVRKRRTGLCWLPVCFVGA